MINMDVSKCLNVKAVGYFIAFTLTGYFLLIAYMHLTLTLDPGLRLFIITSYFVVGYGVAKIFYRNPFKLIHPAPYFESLIHVLALLVPGYAAPVIVIIVSDAKQIYLDAKPSFVNSWNVSLPGYALIFWGITGIIVAYFYHSTTYELFSKKSKFAGMISATALFAINYNTPLITNYWNAWDILFFGLAFAYSYSIKKNPLALLSAYLLSEVPLWWCMLAPLGETAFALYFIVRFVISAAALVVLIKNLYKKKKIFQIQ